jgi:ATP-grasp domain, R2K clade family 3
MSFFTIDVAQTIAGEWIVIECNDGQESGYAAISPFALWQNLIDYVTPKN